MSLILKSKRRGQLLAATVVDIDDVIRLLRDLRPGPERWRESAALAKLEVALARIGAEEDLAALPRLQASRAIEEATHE